MPSVADMSHFRRPPDPTKFTPATWYQGLTRHEAKLARYCESVDAREEVTRDVETERARTDVLAPAALFGEVR